MVAPSSGLWFGALFWAPINARAVGHVNEWRTIRVWMGGIYQIPDTQLEIRLWIWSSYDHDCNLNIACASIGEAVTRTRSRIGPGPKPQLLVWTSVH